MEGCDSVAFAQIIIAWQLLLQAVETQYGKGNVESVVSNLLKRGTDGDHRKSHAEKGVIPSKKNDGVELILHEGHEIPQAVAAFSDVEHCLNAKSNGSVLNSCRLIGSKFSGGDTTKTRKNDGAESVDCKSGLVDPQERVTKNDGVEIILYEGNGEILQVHNCSSDAEHCLGGSFNHGHIDPCRLIGRKFGGTTSKADDVVFSTKNDDVELIVHDGNDGIPVAFATFVDYRYSLCGEDSFENVAETNTLKEILAVSDGKTGTQDGEVAKQANEAMTAFDNEEKVIPHFKPWGLESGVDSTDVEPTPELRSCSDASNSCLLDSKWHPFHSQHSCDVVGAY